MFWDQQVNEPEVRSYKLRAVGGSATISTDTDGGGSGVTISRTGTGAYRLTWADNPGEFQGWHCGLGAATPANLAGHTVVRDTYDESAYTLDFVLYNSSFAAHDLAASEYFDITVDFRDY